MPNYFGTNEITKFYVGSDVVSKVYVGSVEIYSDSIIPESFSVTDAGSTDANGTYTKTGQIINNNPQYSNGTIYVQLIVDDDNVYAWCFTTSSTKYNDSGLFPGVGSVYYYSTTGIFGTWLTNTAGVLPLPTVSS